jgi:hypothetical protein
VEIAAESEHPEVPKEEAAVKSFGSLKRHLAVGRHRKPRKRIQDSGGSRKKWAAGGGMPRHAGMAPHKGRGRQG